MSRAWIEGKQATIQAATAEAARLLSASRLPVIAGLGTDIAGARAAIALADRIGAAVDHMSARAIFRDLDVRRQTGVMVTTPGEAAVRADVLLLVGVGLVTTWPELPARLLAKPLRTRRDAQDERRLVWLCPARDGRLIPPGTARIQALGSDPEDLPVLLAALRARVADRPVGDTSIPLKKIDALVATLRAARFGVAVWSSMDLGSLAIEMLCGLISDLNATTRFSGLPLAPGDNAAGVLQVCGWMTGLPMRTGFGRGYPEHDPWRFDARRLVVSGEADCGLWISAYRRSPPAWDEAIPTIALTAEGTVFRRPPEVHIEVGEPGIDHDAVEYVAEAGALAALVATMPSPKVSVADAIAGIAAALPGAGARPC